MNFAPLRNVPATNNPWEGDCRKKPWEYSVTAVVPVLDTFDTLEVVVETLRHQSERPFICVIDTGSKADLLTQVESLRDEDLEVHVLRLNGCLHPSDFPAMAMDLAFTLCRTPYLFATHADCFLKHKNVIADFLQMCKDISPVVGYQITPRAHEDWKGMVSHTCTMMDMKVMDEIGAGWSLRRLANLFGLKDCRPDPNRPNWPDTELLINYIMRQNDLVPFIVGKEENFCRNEDERMDHCRTLTGGLLYSKSYYSQARGWADDALIKARERITAWKKAEEK